MTSTEVMANCVVISYCRILLSIFIKSILKCQGDDEKTLLKIETMFEIELTKIAINNRRYAVYRDSIK